MSTQTYQTYTLKIGSKSVSIPFKGGVTLHRVLASESSVKTLLPPHIQVLENVTTKTTWPSYPAFFNAYLGALGQSRELIHKEMARAFTPGLPLKVYQGRLLMSTDILPGEVRIRPEGIYLNPCYQARAWDTDGDQISVAYFGALDNNFMPTEGSPSKVLLLKNPISTEVIVSTLVDTKISPSFGANATEFYTQLLAKADAAVVIDDWQAIVSKSLLSSNPIGRTTIFCHTESLIASYGGATYTEKLQCFPNPGMYYLLEEIGMKATRKEGKSHLSVADWGELLQSPFVVDDAYAPYYTRTSAIGQRPAEALLDQELTEEFFNNLKGLDIPLTEAYQGKLESEESQERIALDLYLIKRLENIGFLEFSVLPTAHPSGLPVFLVRAFNEAREPLNLFEGKSQANADGLTRYAILPPVWCEGRLLDGKQYLAYRAVMQVSVNTDPDTGEVTYPHVAGVDSIWRANTGQLEGTAWPSNWSHISRATATSKRLSLISFLSQHVGEYGVAPYAHITAGKLAFTPEVMDIICSTIIVEHGKISRDNLDISLKKVLAAGISIAPAAKHIHTNSYGLHTVHSWTDNGVHPIWADKLADPRRSALQLTQLMYSLKAAELRVAFVASSSAGVELEANCQAWLTPSGVTKVGLAANHTGFPKVSIDRPNDIEDPVSGWREVTIPGITEAKTVWVKSRTGESKYPKLVTKQGLKHVTAPIEQYTDAYGNDIDILIPVEEAEAKQLLAYIVEYGTPAEITSTVGTIPAWTMLETFFRTGNVAENTKVRKRRNKVVIGADAHSVLRSIKAWLQTELDARNFDNPKAVWDYLDTPECPLYLKQLVNAKLEMQDAKYLAELRTAYHTLKELEGSLIDAFSKIK